MKHLRKTPVQQQKSAQVIRMPLLMSNAKSFIEIILTKSEDVL